MTRSRTQDSYTNSVVPPTYNSASYFFNSQTEVVKGLHERSMPLGRYGRYNNPTWRMVEQRLSDLNGAEESLLFGSGMAAHFTTFMTFIKSGDHVVLPSESYRQVRNVFLKIFPNLGVTVHEFSIRDPDKFIEQVRSVAGNLKLIHLEMPSSPHMYLIDVERVRKAVGPDVIITMDSSFSPPPNFFALHWGVDLAIFSGTKYLNGHGDLMAGVVSGRRDLMEELIWYRDTTGAIADGHVASLLNRSLHTLSLRMERINENGLEVANYLDNHPFVRRVLYTGLPSHPHRDLANKYLKGHGGVITFELPLDEKRTAEFVDLLKVPFMASNFGAPQTLIEQSTFFTYFEYSDQELETIGVARGTVRLALGFIDRPRDVIADLDAALEKMMKASNIPNWDSASQIEQKRLSSHQTVPTS